jgi:hypothetical protein
MNHSLTNVPLPVPGDPHADKPLLYADLAVARRRYEMSEAESTMIVGAGLVVGRADMGMGETFFLAPYDNVLDVIELRRPPSAAGVPKGGDHEKSW